MSTKLRVLIVALFLGITSGVAACADGTAPSFQDVGSPSFGETGDSTGTQDGGG